MNNEKMLKQEKVITSVIIPVYNSSSYIKYLLKDIKNQTLKKGVEYLFIDDGSTDNSGLIIRNFIQSENINGKYYFKQNEGVSSARNYGLNRVKGQYVVFLDSDDRISCKLIEKYQNSIIKNQSDIEVFSLKKIYNNKHKKAIRQISYAPVARKTKYSNTEYLKLIANLDAYGYICSYIFKVALWKKVKFDLRLTKEEDLFAIIKILFENKNIKIHINSKGYYYYYINPRSASHGNPITTSIEFLKSTNYILNYVYHEDKKAYEYLLNLRLNNLKGLIINCIYSRNTKLLKNSELDFIKNYKRIYFYSYKQRVVNKIFYFLIKFHLENLLVIKKSIIKVIKRKISHN